MGTRNLTAVVLNGEYRVAQYCQWDGYLEGQGATVFDFIENELDLRKFKTAVNNCTFLTDDQIQTRWKEAGSDGSGWVTMDVSEKLEKMYPQLSRNTGADVLALIQKNGGLELSNSIDFAADSLFCEWAYVLDLDNKVLEIYKGFNTSPLTKGDRFYGLKQSDDEEKSEYEPVRLFKSLPFNKVNKETLKELVKSLDDESEDF